MVDDWLSHQFDCPQPLSALLIREEVAVSLDKYDPEGPIGRTKHFLSLPKCRRCGGGAFRKLRQAKRIVAGPGDLGGRKRGGKLLARGGQRRSRFVGRETI